MRKVMELRTMRYEAQELKALFFNSFSSAAQVSSGSSP